MKLEYELECAYCGNAFRSIHKNKMYCSELCKQEALEAKKRAKKESTMPKRIPKDLEYFYQWKRKHAAPTKYADIRKANRSRKIQSGWRGTPVAGPASVLW